jgi:hypothetical protein
MIGIGNNQLMKNNIIPSIDGKYLAYTYAFNSAYVSSNSGVTFSAILPAKNCQYAAISGDGKYQTFTSYSGYLYTSSDYGANFIERTAVGSKYWGPIGISKTGQYQLATGYRYNSSYRSLDYGATWLEITTIGFLRGTRAAVVSDSGQYQVALFNNYLKISSDYGENWVGGPSLYMTDMAMSGTGQYITAGVNNSHLTRSADYGVNFTSLTTGPYGILGVGMSTTGQYQTCLDTAWVYYSTNYGATWTQSNLTGNGFNGINCNVAVSGDGKFQIVRRIVSGIHTWSKSTDYGATWVSTNKPPPNNGLGPYINRYIE